MAVRLGRSASAADAPPTLRHRGPTDGEEARVARPRMSPEARRAADEGQRRRVLAGLAAALGERGFAATTIADVVAAASISRSTFYAHFEDKEAAFVALYEAGADLVLGVIEQVDAEARAAGAGWRERVETVASAYFRTLADGGEVTRSLLTGIQGLGGEARRARRAVLDRYVDLFAGLARDVAATTPELREPSRTLLLAAVAGMNELLLRAVDDGTLDDLDTLVASATELVTATMRAGVV